MYAGVSRKAARFTKANSTQVTKHADISGRLHVRDEVEEHLARKVAGVSVTPTKGDIIRFLRAKLREDTVLDAIGNTLEEDIIMNIPETVSEL